MQISECNQQMLMAVHRTEYYIWINDRQRKVILYTEAMLCDIFCMSYEI